MSARRLPVRPGATALLLGLAATGCGAAGSTRTLRFESQLSATTNVFVTPGRSLGQELVFTAMLYPPAGPAANGRSQGTCIRAEPGNGAVYNCQLTFIVPGGALYALANSSHNGPAAGVIAGGTGSYKGVRGDFAYVPSGNARIGLTFTLTG